MAFLKPTAFSFILKFTAVINAGVEYLKVKRNGYEMSFLQDSFRLNEISKKYSFITRSTLPLPLRFLTKRRNNLQNITYGWEARLYKICDY